MFGILVIIQRPLNILLLKIRHEQLLQTTNLVMSINPRHDKAT